MKEFIILATQNKNKIVEIREILWDLKDVIKTLDELNIDLDFPQEDGKSYEENAFIKAKFVADKTGYPSIGEDSGLEIDLLKGELGIYSARFGGDISYKEKMNLILERLKNVPWEERKARFVCKVVYYDPHMDIKIVTGGLIEGYIALEPKGEKGFGYDPIFYFPPLKKTFAEISEEEKNRFSHRSIAFNKLKLILNCLIKGGKL